MYLCLALTILNALFYLSNDCTPSITLIKSFPRYRILDSFMSHLSIPLLRYKTLNSRLMICTDMKSSKMSSKYQNIITE